MGISGNFLWFNYIQNKNNLKMGIGKKKKKIKWALALPKHGGASHKTRSECVISTAPLFKPFLYHNHLYISYYSSSMVS